MSISESAEGLVHGHTVVGTTAVKVTKATSNLKPQKGVLFRTPGANDPTPNTHCVWVGNSNVTADSDITSGGYPLAPGEALFVPTSEVDDLYAVAGAASQDIAWMVI